MVSSAMETAMTDVIHLHQTLDTLQEHIGSTPAGATSSELQTLDTKLVTANSPVHTPMNSLSPIDRLPPEILSRIFTFEKHESPGVSAFLEAHIRVYGPLGLGSAKDFVPLTEVCRRWRDIIVHTSKFWSTIEDCYVVTRAGGPRAIKPRTWLHFIHRNPDGPLHVQVRDDLSEELYALLQSSGARVDDLEAARVQGDLFIRLVSFPANGLRTCRLSFARDLGSTSLTLFNGHAPRLRALRLNSCHFIPANVFPSLTHLIIIFLGGESPSSAVEFSFTDVIKLLGNCPSLEVLYYITRDCVRVKDLPAPGDIPQKVTLSKLRKLCVEEYHLDPGHSPGWFQVALCGHLDLPPECLVSIQPASIADFQHHARTLSPGLAAGDTLCLRVVPKEKEDDSPALDAMCVRVVDSRRPLGLRIEVGYDPVRSTEEAREQIRRVLSSSPLFSAVTVLDVSRLIFECLMGTPSVLAELLHVQTLAVANINGSTRGLETLTMARTHSIAFPQLKTLALFRLAMAQLEDVHDIVQSRAEAGYPLDRVVLVLRRPYHESSAEALDAVFRRCQSSQLFLRASSAPYPYPYARRGGPNPAGNAMHAGTANPWSKEQEDEHELVV